MNNYAVVVASTGVHCTVFTGRGSYNLPHIVVHSPDGFNIGYAGSGPCDLGLSILTDYFDETEEKVKSGREVSKAWALHYMFTRDFIAPHTENFVITIDQIKKWVGEYGN